MDVAATVKLLAGLLLFPLTWTLVGVVAGSIWGAAPGMLAALATAAIGWIMIVTTKIWGSLVRTRTSSGRARKAGIDRAQIVRRRAEIVREMTRLAGEG